MQQRVRNFVGAMAVLVTSIGLAGSSARGQAPSSSEGTAAIAFVGSASARRWDAYAIPSAGSPRRLGFAVDAGGSASSFHGSDAPLLSPDGRTLAYLREGRLRLRDLATDTERTVPTTTGGPRAAYLGGFAVDSSALLFFDRTHVADPSAQDDEGAEMELAGEHRIFVIATGEVRTIGIDEASEQPGVLESATSLLVIARDGTGAGTTSTLERRRWSSTGIASDALATAPTASGFGQIVAAPGRLAWLTETGIVMADANAVGVRALSPTGRFADYQWPTFGPGSAASYHHMQRVPRRGGGFDVRPAITVVDTTTNASAVRYTCVGLCSSGFADATTVLVLEGSVLSRIGEDGRARRVRSSVRAVAFRGSSR